MWSQKKGLYGGLACDETIVGTYMGEATIEEKAPYRRSEPFSMPTTNKQGKTKGLDVGVSGWRAKINRRKSWPMETRDSLIHVVLRLTTQEVEQNTGGL